MIFLYHYYFFHYSERADATGATGQRLKEGAHINKSLVTLGSVISALAEQANKTGSKVFIPYRDSVLTWLLKDSLGGNSKTIMIATISPADVNHGETLSTLRYANRAKNIINKPTINEDPNVKLIRELREEITKLKTMIGEDENTKGSGEAGSIMAELSKKQAQEKVLTDQWTERWKETHKILQEQQTLGLRKAGHGVILDSERPHLVLIDDDLLSTGVTLYHLNDGITTLGALHTQDIRLQGGGVLDEHCIIDFSDGLTTLTPKPDAHCWINSLFIEEPTRLSQGCVVVLGGSHMFRYNDPQEAARLRKEGNKSHLNLSRLSFLSRSTTDLFRSCDVLPGLETEGNERRNNEDSGVFHGARINRINETADFCEMSTQTSHHSHSQPTTPINPLDTSSAFQAARKASLTLPIINQADENNGLSNLLTNSNSLNSTPASDTFYTATSVLTPDPSELISPYSPFSPDIQSPMSGALGLNSLVTLPEVPNKYENDELNNPKRTNRMDDLISEDLRDLVASPIQDLQQNHKIKEINSDNVLTSTPKIPSNMKNVATSTPKREIQNKQDECNANVSRIDSTEDGGESASSDSFKNLRLSSSENNNTSCDTSDVLQSNEQKTDHNWYIKNGGANDFKDNQQEPVNQDSCSDDFNYNKSSFKDEYKVNSGFIDAKDDLSKASEVIQRIQEEALNGNRSMEEKVIWKWFRYSLD